MAVLKFDDFQVVEVEAGPSIGETLVSNIIKFSKVENLPKYKPTGTEEGGAILVFDNGFDDYREHALYEIKSSAGVITSELIKLDARRFRVLRGAAGGGEVIIHLTPLKGWEVEETPEGAQINHPRGSLFLDTTKNEGLLKRGGEVATMPLFFTSPPSGLLLLLYNKDKIIIIAFGQYYRDTMIFIDFSIEALYVEATSTSPFTNVRATAISEKGGVVRPKLTRDEFTTFKNAATAYSLTVYPSIANSIGAPLLPFMQTVGRHQDAFPSDTKEPEYTRTAEGLFISLRDSLLRVRGA